MHTEFTLMLEAESLALDEGRSPSMSTKQRNMVASLGRTGWEIKKREKDKVTMQKGDKEMFVYDSGETFVLSEGKEENITEMMEALLEGEDILEEGILQNLINKFRSNKTKMKFYSNGVNGVICIARTGNTKSLYHTVKGEIIKESSTIDDKAIEDYVDHYEQRGYRKVVNRAMLMSVMGVIISAGAIGLGAGIAAGIGFRLVASLAALREQAKNAEAVGATDEQIRELAMDVEQKVEKSIQMNGDEVSVDMEPLYVPPTPSSTPDQQLQDIPSTFEMVTGIFTKTGKWLMNPANSVFAQLFKRGNRDFEARGLDDIAAGEY